MQTKGRGDRLAAVVARDPARLTTVSPDLLSIVKLFPSALKNVVQGWHSNRSV